MILSCNRSTLSANVFSGSTGFSGGGLSGKIDREYRLHGILGCMDFVIWRFSVLDLLSDGPKQSIFMLTMPNSSGLLILILTEKPCKMTFTTSNFGQPLIG